MDEPTISAAELPPVAPDPSVEHATSSVTVSSAEVSAPGVKLASRLPTSTRNHTTNRLAGVVVVVGSSPRLTAQAVLPRRIRRSYMRWAGLSPAFPVSE